MSGRKRRERALKSFLDIFAICLILLIFSCVYLAVLPYNQGFYCDDRTILKPYRNDTIPMWMVGVYAGVLPVIIIIFIELWRYMPIRLHHMDKQDRLDICRNVFHTVCMFSLGVGATFLLTEVGKRSYGRLRPHFIEVCRPDWSKIQCYDRFNLSDGQYALLPRYITDYQCTGGNPARLKEARISFPSGHSSFTCFAFGFLLVYFESRLFCSQIRFLKPVLQCACICIMFFTCLSRITDHKHHYSDVIGGAIIGTSVAFFITLRVANAFNLSQNGRESTCIPEIKYESKSTQYELDKGYATGGRHDGGLGDLQQRHKHQNGKLQIRIDKSDDMYDNLPFYQAIRTSRSNHL